MFSLLYRYLMLSIAFFCFYPKCDRNLPVCNHCADEEDTECNYTPKKRHKVPSDHAATRDRPVAPYAAKTASFLVTDMPAGQGDTPSGDNGSTSGPSGSHVYEREIRTEPQIRQYMPPHSPALHDGDEMEHSPDMEFKQSGDGNFTWVCHLS